MKLNDLEKLRASILIVHVAAITGLVFLWDPSWLLISLFSYVSFLWLGHDLYYHRYLSHRSFYMPRWMQKVCSVLGIYCLFGTPIGIASTHVKHHGHSDTDKDPHPAKYPFAAWFWTYHQMEVRDRATVVRLSKDKWLCLIGRNYFVIYFFTILLAFIINPKIALYGFFIPAVYGFFSNGLVNVVCHKWGYKRYQTSDNARNNLVVNVFLLFGGIALHNTHHAYPKSYILSRSWYEIDLVGAIAGCVNSLKKSDI